MTVKVLHTHILMVDEIKRLRETNKKQIKKVARSKRKIAHEGSLTDVLDITHPVGLEEGGAGEYISGLLVAPEPLLNLHYLFCPLYVGKLPVPNVAGKGIDSPHVRNGFSSSTKYLVIWLCNGK